MTNEDMTSACPRCGSTAAVHSIQELAALASSQLNQGQLNQAQAGQPQAGQPGRGWEAEPQAGPLPGPGGVSGGSGSGGGFSGSGGGFGGGGGGFSGGGLRNTRNYDTGARNSNPLDALGEDIAGAAVSAAVGFAARAISRRMQRTMSERVVPTLMAHQQTVLETQLEIAHRHPDLCACLTDHVMFLAGGSRVLPLPNLMKVTVEQADELVAQLRNG